MNVISTMPDFSAIKQRQQATWATGDYAVVGTTLQIVGEQLCEAVDLRAGERVIDVAAGNGNATLAAARRWAEVTATDYVPQLLDRARERATAERLTITFQEADAEALPFADNGFDVVLSTFGVMFPPDQDKAASELDEGLQAWRAHRPRQLDAGWLHRTAVQDHRFTRTASDGRALAGIMGNGGTFAGAVRRPGDRSDTQVFNFRYSSADHWLDVFKTFYGPTNRAFAALEGDKQAALKGDLLALLGRLNRGGVNSLIVPSEYLEVVVTKA